MPVFFVVLGLHRTGSNLLISALDAHKEVAVSGELFQERESSRKFSGATAGGVYYRDGTDGAAFINQHVFHDRYDPTIVAAGFKLFYSHATLGPASSVWPRLIQDERMRIIRMQRQNLLDMYLSNEVAIRTHEWWISPKQKPTVMPAFPLEAPRLHRFFEWATEGEAWADQVFRNHRSLVIQYERDILHAYDACISAVQSFLGLNRQVIPPRIRKQSVRSSSEQISNYHELKRSFQNSPYAAFFQ
jgi:LPS sulfotransferase NodH